MSGTDLKLCGLSISVLGRELPEATDYPDGEWLICRASMQAGRSSVTTEGSILMSADFERFRRELEAMHSTLRGESSLSGLEPNLKVTLRAESLGRISGEVEITPNQLTEFHRFNVGFDQSYLPPLIAACEAILMRFPVVGQAES